MFKTVSDVKRVIDKRRPPAVIDAFITSYLAGCAWQAWEEKNADRSCLDFTADNLLVLPKPDLAAWKLVNYALFRRAAYGLISGQLELIQEKGLDAWLVYCKLVKKNWPKPS